MMGKDQVTNISTALMAINELSSYYDIPINIHFDAEGRIYVHVGFGTFYRKEMSFYPQDTYRVHSKTDDIYKWIEETAEIIAAKKMNTGIASPSRLLKEMKEIIDPAERASEACRSMGDIMSKLAKGTRNSSDHSNE